MFIYPIYEYNYNWRNISTIYIYITRLESNEIFSPSNKIHREVGRGNDLSAPLYKPVTFLHHFLLLPPVTDSPCSKHCPSHLGVLDAKHDMLVELQHCDICTTQWKFCAACCVYVSNRAVHILDPPPQPPPLTNARTHAQ